MVFVVGSIEIELNTSINILNFFDCFTSAFYMYRVLNLLIGNCAMHCTCISLE